jgi:hypothetical protein
LNTARRGAAAASCDEIAFIFGGYNGVYLDSIEEYNSEADTWTTVETRLTIARVDLQGVVVNRRIYLLGGYDGGAIDVVESFETSDRSCLTVSPLRNRRQNHGAATVYVPVSVLNGWIEVESRIESRIE